MIVSLLCTSRSGSTSVSTYLSKVLNLPIVSSPFMRGDKDLSNIVDGSFYKLFIHNQTKGFNSLFLFGEEIIKRSNIIILYDRMNKTEQSESLAFRQSKYGSDLTKYHKKEIYNTEHLDLKKVMECKDHFEEHSLAIRQLSEKYNLPIFYYENIFYGDGLTELSDYIGVPTDNQLKELYLNPTNRERGHRNILI